MQAMQYIMGDFLRDWLVCEGDLEQIDNNQYSVDLIEAMRKRKKSFNRK